MATKPIWMSQAEVVAAAKAADHGEAMLHKGFTAVTISPVSEKGRMRVCISTADVDRDNDTIEVAGWDLGSYMKNPVVLWAHDHKSLPVGKAVSVGIEGGQLVAEMEFADHELAKTVQRLYEGGFMRAFSVGFRAKQNMFNEERGGVDFKEQELLEFSTVPVPANPMALVAASAAGADLETMRKWMGDLIEAWPGDLKLTGKAWRKLGGEAEPEPVDPAADALARINSAGDAAAAKLTQACAAVLAQITEALSAKSETPSLTAVAEVVIDPAVVAAAVEPMLPAAIKEEDDDAVFELAESADDELEFELADGGIELSVDGEEADFTAEDIRAALAATMPAAVRAMAQEAAQRSIREMLGRLD